MITVSNDKAVAMLALALMNGKQEKSLSYYIQEAAYQLDIPYGYSYDSVLKLIKEYWPEPNS